MLIKTPQKIDKIRKAGHLLASIFDLLLPKIKAGMTTLEIDKMFNEEIAKADANSSCIGFFNYPAATCISVNDQVTHGIPDDYALKNGDIVDVDVVLDIDNAFADMSYTLKIGEVSDIANKLVRVSKECLYKGIEQVKPGNTLNDIGIAIERHAKENGFSVVREYVGHFIGDAIHEEPEVLNYCAKDNNLKLKEGMIFCIEPMINEGNWQVTTEGWDVRTKDHKLSSRFEHMILVTKDGYEILTPLKFDQK